MRVHQEFNNPMRWLELKIPPPVVVVLLALGMYVGDRVLPGTGSTLPWHTALAICAAVAGITVNIAGILAFRRHRTTVNPLQPHRASKLVRDGIFRWTRNPMYLGMVLILISWAFQLASFVAFTGPVLLFAWLTRFQIIPEERILKQGFPDDFAAYAREVRRWL